MPIFYLFRDDLLVENNRFVGVLSTPVSFEALAVWNQWSQMLVSQN